MNDEWLIYPGVKRAAAVLARAALVCMLAAAVCAPAEIACSMLAAAVQSQALLSAALLCGAAASVLLLAAVACLGPLAAWCHLVLVAGRGSAFTRFLTQIGAFLSLMIPACAVYTVVAGEPLLARQAEIPPYVCLILLISVLINLPNMKAAPVKLRALAALLPLFMLGATLTDVDGLLAIRTVCTLAAAACAWMPLRALSATAERIVSLPEREDI